ncbi:MAG TPA: competence/damage-inducible protein A [archaeon]|nr:competence/damage-inducible protein A [archaeon]
MDIAILTVGTEILKGRISNTNAQYMAHRLYSSGFNVREIRCVGDEESEIKKTLAGCFSRVNVVISTGGLGPTRDDVTKKAASDFFYTRLVTDQKLSAHLEKLFQRLGYSTFPERSRNQALFPEGARILPNPRGTASGLLLEKNGKLLFLLPGVPVEMRGLLDEEVLPLLTERFAAGRPLTLLVRTVGLGESALAERIENGLSEGERSLLSYYPHGGMVDLVIASPESRPEAEESTVRQVADHVAEHAADYLYARDERSLISVIAELLVSRELKLAVAESCTGGLFSKTITDLPGSSAYFQAGVVSYSNEAKTMFLGVPEQLIREHGAVSEAVAQAMAGGIKERTGANLALAITGIAGPGGGGEGKPVGTVYIALNDSSSQTAVHRLNFTGDREQIRHRSAVKAAEILWRSLTKTPC